MAPNQRSPSPFSQVCHSKPSSACTHRASHTMCQHQYHALPLSCSVLALLFSPIPVNGTGGQSTSSHWFLDIHHWLLIFLFPTTFIIHYHSHLSFSILFLYGIHLHLLPGCAGFSLSMSDCHRTFVEHEHATTFPCFLVTVYKVRSNFSVHACRQLPPAISNSCPLHWPTMSYPYILCVHSSPPSLPIPANLSVSFGPCSWVCPSMPSPHEPVPSPSFLRNSDGCPSFKNAPQGSAICLLSVSPPGQESPADLRCLLLPRHPEPSTVLAPVST